MRVPLIRILNTIGSHVYSCFLLDRISTFVEVPDETDCISHCTNALGKGMNPIILPPAMGK